MTEIKVTNTAEFIQAANMIHAERYGYDKAIYRSPTQRLTLSCKKHGDFDIMAREHLEGKGCVQCKREEDFINKVHLKYGELFNTDKVNYVNASTPVELVCTLHGSFYLSPEKVLSNACACSQCAEDAIRKQAENTRIRAYERKIKALNDEQQEKDNYYSRLISQLASSSDTYQDYINKIVGILLELDDFSLEEVNKKLRDEIRRRKGGTSLPQNAAKQEFDISLLPESFVSIDFETLYPQRVSACSVGMVKYKDGQIVDRYYTLIRPPFDYPGKKGMALTWIHGFTEDMFEGECTMEDILPEMEAFAEGLPLVAHNSCVERACIEETARYYGIVTSLDTNNIIDTLPLSRNTEKALGIFQDGPGVHSLNIVCNRFGVEELHHHNALDDAEMCGNLLLALKKVSTNTESFVTPKKTSISQKYSKYNEEDKEQRTDLEDVPDNPFKDCCVVLTGFANTLSQEYGHKLKEAGAKICTGVSCKTKWLICGPNAGPAKMEKAKQVGAQIINEERFLELIN